MLMCVHSDCVIVHVCLLFIQMLCANPVVVPVT